MLKNLIILFLTLFYSNIVFSQDDQIRELCESIHQYQSSSHYNFKKQLWRGVKLRLFPGLYSRPKSLVVPVSTQLVAPVDLLKFKNIIFFVGLSETESLKARGFRNDFNETQKELKKIALQFSAVKKTKSVNDCIEVVKNKNINFQKLNELAKKTNEQSFKNYQRERETATFLKQIQKLQGSLHQNWIVQKVSHLEDINQWLKSHQVGNVVIVTHGLTSGHIIDSFNNQYPNGFFSQISPTLYSLSFYNCYGDKTLKTYQIEEKLQSLPSYYTSRLVTVAKSPSDSEIDQVAPIRGFSRFMSKLDATILNKRKKNIPPISNIKVPVLQKCFLKVESSSFVSGTPGISLNGKFIGALKSDMMKKSEIFGEFQLMDFPCDWLKDKGNLVTLLNLSDIQWDLKNPPEIFLGDLKINPQIFLTADQKLRSALYRF